MFRKLQPALIVTRREIRDQFRDWRILIPIFVLTLIFPAIMNFTAKQAVQFVERYGAPIIGDRLIPFLLMVVGFFPISVSLVIALESFVGEKERRSIEPLLSTPLSDWQLYLGKLLAVLFPPLVASYLGISVYLVGVYRQVGWVPEVILLVQILALTTVQSLVMVSGAVVISSQATSVRAANLLASFIIIPMAFLIQGESLVMFWGRYPILWWAIFGLIVVALLLVRTGVSHFNREELLGREFDTINWRWGWRLFWLTFFENARSVRDWYKRAVIPTIRELKTPLILLTILLLLSVWVGVSQAGVFVIPPEAFNLEDLRDGSVENMQAVSLFSTRGILTIWMHNIRAVLLAMLLGVFSFGVFGLIALFVAPMLVGYFMAILAGAGLSPGVFLASFILPHGIFEIPAILFAGAAILQMGASLATPAKEKSVGEAWLRSFAKWAKIMIGVVLPLLFAAAVMEALITPRVALWMLGR
jgi:uncharacterized membrane protein SpoIIM required for sporulation/ABC-type transport system involved in multi-copper enzyme maturation permease subunit